MLKGLLKPIGGGSVHPQQSSSSGEIMSRDNSNLNEKGSAKNNMGFTSLFKNKQITSRNLLVSGVIIGLEVLLSTEVFDCPVNNHKAYGTAFLVAPVIIIFFTSLVVLGELPMLTDKCCVKRYRKRYDCSGRVMSGILKASFAPSFWLITSFLDTTYYVCREVGPAIEKRNLTNETEIKILQEKFAKAKSDSQVWAWVVFAVLVPVTAIVIIFTNCALKDRFSLDRREDAAAVKAFHEGTRHLKLDKKEEIKMAHLLETSKEVTLCSDGAPEQFARKQVEKLLAEKKDWKHHEVYKVFQRMYPRATSGFLEVPENKTNAEESVTSNNSAKPDSTPEKKKEKKPENEEKTSKGKRKKRKNKTEDAPP